MSEAFETGVYKLRWAIGGEFSAMISPAECAALIAALDGDKPKANPEQLTMEAPLVRLGDKFAHVILPDAVDMCGNCAADYQCKIPNGVLHSQHRDVKGGVTATWSWTDGVLEMVERWV